MLNPETLSVRRVAGVHSRQSLRGPLAGAALTDDPLLYTGGGKTELTLDLLFDLGVGGSSVSTDDVRDLTRPLVELAQAAPAENGYSEPPVVRFVWGKSWNIPGVVAAVSERLEQFTSEGTAQRSWLRMRFLRIAETPDTATPPAEFENPETPLELDIPPEDLTVHEVMAGGPSEPEGGGSNERLDEIANRVYGDSRFWRLIANFNQLENPLELSAGRLLRLPPKSAIGGSTA